MARKAGKLNFGSWEQFLPALQEAYGEGREEWTRSFRKGREAENLAENAPRMTEMTGAYPTGIRIAETFQDLMGRGVTPIEAKKREIRENLGIGAKEGIIPRAGQLLGTIGADLTQDSTRNFYWLLNAAQATGNVINESVLGSKRFGNPDLFGKHQLLSKEDSLPLSMKKDVDRQMAQEQGYLDVKGNPTKGVSIGNTDDKYLEKRNYEPGHLAALAIPTGIAINSGLGLMTPFGGAEGYFAASPSKDDPTKTDNVISEVALKYFMGKTGNLLPYDEFAKVRPDVSPEEYGRYQAFKYDRTFDANPFDDGKVNLFTAIKTTPDGIHGAELQFLGRSLPVTTGIVPYATALAGGLAGVRRGKAGKTAVRDGFIGGLGGLAAGQVAGNLLEQERRRRNTAENQLEMPQG